MAASQKPLYQLTEGGNRRRTKKISKHLRDKVRARDNETCQQCGKCRSVCSHCRNHSQPIYKYCIQYNIQYYRCGTDQRSSGRMLRNFHNRQIAL